MPCSDYGAASVAGALPGVRTAVVERLSRRNIGPHAAVLNALALRASYACAAGFTGQYA